MPEASTGNIKRAIFELSLIPLPPLPEQQRIVAILDEAFDGIATAKANAEKNLQNARALFESHLQSVFTERAKGGWRSRWTKSADAQTRDAASTKGTAREYPFVRSRTSLDR